MKAWLASLLTALVLVAASGCATVTSQPSSGASQLPQGVPLPPNITIEPPDPTLPKELAAFSGIWVGAWRGTHPFSVGYVDAVVIVESITPQTR